MSLLPECPRCGGMMTGNIKTKLSSACRCGFQTSATWADLDRYNLEILADEAPSQPSLLRVSGIAGIAIAALCIIYFGAEFLR